MRLFVPKNNERMITKKKKEKNDQEIGETPQQMNNVLLEHFFPPKEPFSPPRNPSPRHLGSDRTGRDPL